MERKKKAGQRKKRYRCSRCGYIVSAERKKLLPYCPQCAVVHYKGELVPISG